MKKTIFRILSTAIIIIVCFIGSFIIGLQILNTFESNAEETEVIQEDENSQKDNTQTSSQEDIFINCDIEATKSNSFVGIITEVDIDKKQITVENPSHLVNHETYHADYEWRNNHKVIIDGKTYVKAGYLLCLDNVPIKDYNGDKIEVHDLKAGDTINVRTINVEYINNIIFEPFKCDNIVSIERKSKKAT